MILKLLRFLATGISWIIFWINSIFQGIVSIFNEKFNGKSHKKPSVAVIGAGVSGLCAAIKLKEELGVELKIFEASKDVGGTWLTNTYPDCSCDSPGSIYSFSFAMNPKWPKLFPKQLEMLPYLKNVAQKYGLYEHTLFNTKVHRISWIDEKQKWKLEYKSKSKNGMQSAYFDFVVPCLGPLKKPRIPEMLKKFQGPLMHTAQWDSTLDFKNKKVAFVGNGPSAAQVVPHLQKIVPELINYQRSPGWVVPKPNFTYPKLIEKLYILFPFLMRLERYLWFCVFDAMYPLVMRHYDSRGTKLMTRFLTKHMTNCLEKRGRKDLAKILIPNYSVFCNGLTLSSKFLQSLCEPNVKVKMGEIKDIRGRTIYHSDGSAETVDILVMATGYEALQPMDSMEVIGKNGASLNEKWEVRFPETFQGIYIHGYPNLFMVAGPNACPFNANILTNEVQANALIRTIKFITKNNLGAIEPKETLQKVWTDNIKSSFDGSVFTSNCNAYMKGEKGEIYVFYPGCVAQYWWAIRWTDYFKDFHHYPKAD